MDFKTIDVPANGYERRHGNPFWSQLGEAIKTLEHGKALVVPVPEGKQAKTMMSQIACLYRPGGRFHNESYRVRCSLLDERNIAVWQLSKQ